MEIGLRAGWAGIALGLATIGCPALAAQDQAPPSTTDRGILTVQDAIMALQRADAKTRSTPVRVLGNPGGFFGAAAYPPEAMRANEQGRSVVRVEVDAKGYPTACSVFSSSGSSALDQATCRIATTRMQFSAARDEKGRAIAGQYTLPVRWVLPVASLPKAVNSSMETQIAVGTDGAVESCTDSATGSLGGGPCAIWPVGRKIIAPPMRDGRPVKAHIVISMDVVTSLDP